MNSIYQLRRNYLYSILYHLMLIIYPFIITPYLARIFGSYGIGSYTMVHTIASYFLQLAMMGVATYGSRQVAYIRDNMTALRKGFTEIYCAQVIYCTIALIGYVIYTLFFSIGNIDLVWIHLLFIISAFFDISWLFYGVEKIDQCVKVNVFIKLMTIFAILYCVKDIDDIWKYTAIICFGVLLSNLVLWIKGFKMVPLCKVDCRGVTKHIYPLLVLFIPVIGASVYKSMDKVMLGVITDSNELVGWYSNSEQMLGIPQGIITAIGAVMLPRVSNMVANGEVEKIKRNLRMGMGVVNFLAIGTTFGIASIATEFVPLFLGDDFFNCVEYVLLLAPSNMLICWGYTIRNQYLIPYMKDKIYINSIVAGAGINFILNLFLIKKYEIVGVIIGTLLSELLVALWQTWAIRRNIETRRYIVDMMPFIGCALIMTLIIRIVGNAMGRSAFTVAVEILIGGGVYVCMSVAYLFMFDRKRFYSWMNALRLERID